MAEEQGKLFNKEPDREYDPGTAKTWKDQALEEDRAALHSERDEFDRRDDQGRETTGQIQLETTGETRRRAERLLNITVAKNILDESSRQRREAEEAQKAEAEARRDEELLQLMRDTNPHPEPDDANKAA